MTIDLFDLNGRGIIEQDGFAPMLREVKPVLNAMQESGAFSKPRDGVCVLIDERASYHLHTKSGKSMEELYPEEVFWAGLLPAMGVPMGVLVHMLEDLGEHDAVEFLRILKKLSSRVPEDFFPPNDAIK